MSKTDSLEPSDANPIGRPTDYRAQYCEQVIELGRQGKSHAQIAAALDQARMTLYRWQEQFPEFSDAMTRAKDLAQAWWEDQGQTGLVIPGFNATLWGKQVTCRFRADYTEVVKNEHSGPDGKPIEVAAVELTVEERRARIAQLMQETGFKAPE